MHRFGFHCAGVELLPRPEEEHDTSTDIPFANDHNRRYMRVKGCLEVHFEKDFHKHTTAAVLSSLLLDQRRLQTLFIDISVTAPTSIEGDEWAVVEVVNRGKPRLLWDGLNEVPLLFCLLFLFGLSFRSVSFRFLSFS